MSVASFDDAFAYSSISEEGDDSDYSFHPANMSEAETADSSLEEADMSEPDCEKPEIADSCEEDDMSESDCEEAGFFCEPIPPLQSFKWAEFKTRTHDFMKFSGYTDLLEGTAAKPVQGEAESDAEFAPRICLYTSRMRKACQLVFDKCGDMAHAQVKRETDLKKIMAILEKHTTSQRNKVISDLIRQFCHLRLQDFKNVDEYSRKLNQIQADLKKMDPKKASIPPLFMIFRFMDGLGLGYGTHVADYQRDCDILVEYPSERVFAHLVRATLIEEQRRRDDDAGASIAHAQRFLANDANKRIVDWCTRCEVVGHQLAHCFSEHPELAPTGWIKRERGKDGRFKKRKGNGKRKGDEHQSKRRKRS